PPRRPGRGVTRARPPGVRRGAAPGPAGAASRVLTRELSATAVTLSVRLVDGCSPDGAAVPRGETGDERRAGRGAGGGAGAARRAHRAGERGELALLRARRAHGERRRVRRVDARAQGAGG